MTARFTGLVRAGDAPLTSHDNASTLLFPWGSGRFLTKFRKAAKGQLWEREAERDSREGLFTLGVWLAASVEGCTCGMESTYYQHEPYCGTEPVRRISDFPSRTAAREGDIPLTTNGIIHGKRAQ